jgi:hypothetical protein
MAVKAADQVVADVLSWLWPAHLPPGKLIMLDGDPDLGKSLIALDLCARLSTGRPFPDGQPSPGPTNTLVLSAEDAATDTIVPRLRRLGADLRRVFVWQRDRDDEDWPWRFPTHAARLDDALARTDARLAVVDPIMAFLDDSVLCASDRSVRRALAPLLQLAEKHRCAVLMHRHLNKQGGSRALYRGLGSIAFVAACRFAMLVGRDPLVPGRCVLAQVRNSLAGPRTSDDIWDAARKARLAPRTVQRAKPDVGIICRRVYLDGRLVSYWLLPGQKLVTGNADVDEVQHMLAELERQHPPRNPLDEDDAANGSA